MQVPQGVDANVTFDNGTGSECDVLVKIARIIGTAAGYYQRSSRGDMLADAEQLLLRAPERSLLAAAGVGLLFGTALRGRR